MDQDIRWEQRFSNYIKALQKLTQAVEYIKQNFINDEGPLNNDGSEFVLDEIIKEGLIQRFEYTHELAWNVMKDYAAYQGNTTIEGSRDATREAFQLQLISNGKVWMDMIGSSNKTSHTYNEGTANEIFLKTLNEYFPAFVAFKETMDEKKSGNQLKLF